jgi:hypothetical protein
MSETYYSDLLRHGLVAGHDAGPDDYDRARRELAEVRAWAKNQSYDHVAALAAGMLTALACIDPRDRVPSEAAASRPAAAKPSRRPAARLAC